MKYVDFSSLLNRDPAHIAFLSTFQFDPDFFERRLLRSPTLAKARRIVVFLDARQWFELLRRDVPARWLNRRYLVVPVHCSQGVFHPKLNLLLTESGGQVLCGSNNLTRSGCSSNLELLNAISFDFEGHYPEEINVAREAFAFFERAAQKADDEIARIVVEWLEETKATYPWLKEPVDSHAERTIRLIHTYDGSIWDRLVLQLNGDKPRDFFIVSPYHDANGEMCRRLTSQWPRAKVELLVQQGYTNLAIKPLKNLRTVKLSELRVVSRRIHAKLFAWRTRDSGGCLVGSANFTSAALDGRNVEACLLLSDSDELVKALFDRQVDKRPLALDDFVPGDAETPESVEGLPSLRINSALLADGDRLRVSYSHQLDPTPSSLRLTIRTPGETRPRASMTVPKKPNATETLLLPDNVLADAYGTLLVALVAEVEGENIESLPVWVIQESRLTYEPGEGSSSSKGKIEDTGEGLPEYLDELGKRDGVAAVTEYLQHLNIRFYDGGGGGPGQRKFRLKIRDPFHADVAPDWLIVAKAASVDLGRTLDDFIERHEKQRLYKHASRGNINGMENFLDILTALVRLLYVYFRRGVVTRDSLIIRYRTFIELAIIGRKAFGEDAERESFIGYLDSVYDNLDGDVKMLQEVCDTTHYLAEIRAVLLIVQNVRFEPKHAMFDSHPHRPREVLPYYAGAITKAISDCGLSEPAPKDVKRSLEDYRMFSDMEIDQLIAELPE
ncbi:MAG: hypothetical protein K8T91_27635 [Planctomycetes bacterium]|nr:hypothetical protein [Planctomycetota bacterium]